MHVICQYVIVGENAGRDRQISLLRREIVARFGKSFPRFLITITSKPLRKVARVRGYSVHVTVVSFEESTKRRYCLDECLRGTPRNAFALIISAFRQLTYLFQRWGIPPLSLCRVNEFRRMRGDARWRPHDLSNPVTISRARARYALVKLI